jgi:hypothetical protein
MNPWIICLAWVVLIGVLIALVEIARAIASDDDDPWKDSPP